MGAGGGGPRHPRGRQGEGLQGREKGARCRPAGESGPGKGGPGFRIQSAHLRNGSTARSLLALPRAEPSPPAILRHSSSDAAPQILEGLTLTRCPSQGPVSPPFTPWGSDDQVGNTQPVPLTWEPFPASQGELTPTPSSCRPAPCPSTSTAPGVRTPLARPADTRVWDVPGQQFRQSGWLERSPWPASERVPVAV